MNKIILILLGILLAVPIAGLVICFLLWKALGLISNIIKPIFYLGLAASLGSAYILIPWSKAYAYIDQNVQHAILISQQTNNVAAASLWILLTAFGIFIMACIPLFLIKSIKSVS